MISALFWNASRDRDSRGFVSWYKDIQNNLESKRSNFLEEIFFFLLNPINVHNCLSLKLILLLGNIDIFKDIEHELDIFSLRVYLVYLLEPKLNLQVKL